MPKNMTEWNNKVGLLNSSSSTRNVLAFLGAVSSLTSLGSSLTGRDKSALNLFSSSLREASCFLF